MENRRAVILLLVSLVALAGLAPSAQAYDNVVFHSAINTAATVGFIPGLMQSDPTLANAWLDFSKLVSGHAWDIRDGKDKPPSLDYSQNISIFRAKPMGLWIVGGGFSGDEPEAPMAVRHFYDPVYEPRYLTDQMGLAKNPGKNAIEWVLSANENRFSFYNGKINFTKALASDNPEKYGYYGSAWRAVGETMHVMTDLCNPAHVRNDGHVSNDPLESVAGMYNVTRFARYSPASLDYSCTLGTRSLGDVMGSVARWTNNNFFSDDTIPYPGGGQRNGEKVYPLPVASKEPDAQKYYYTIYNDKKIIAYKQTLSSFCGIESTSYDVEGEALDAQLQRVIPTAIRASEAVLDAFLPRFAVFVDSATVKGGPGASQCTVTAHIYHIKTSEWQSDLTIRNGAHILVKNPITGKHEDTLVQASSSGTLNQLTVDIPNVQPGDQVTVYYDFGGYKVYSDTRTVEQAPPAPTVTPAPAIFTEAPDMIWVGTDYHGRIGGDFDGINVIYYSKYAFADSPASDVPVTGRIIVDTDGVFGPPIEYSWARTFQRNTQYKPDTQGVIKAFYLTVPRTAAPGTYTGSITVTDNFGHICTKIFTFTIER